MPIVDEIISKAKELAGVARRWTINDVLLLVSEIERLRAEIDERWRAELELRRYIGIALTLAFQDDSNGIRRELNSRFQLTLRENEPYAADPARAQEEAGE